MRRHLAIGIALLSVSAAQAMSKELNESDKSLISMMGIYRSVEFFCEDFEPDYKSLVDTGMLLADTKTKSALETIKAQIQNEKLKHAGLISRYSAGIENGAKKWCEQTWKMFGESGDVQAGRMRRK